MVCSARARRRPHQSPVTTSAMKSSVLAVVVPLLCLLAARVAASPIRYDQRQDGDWNVDARLQNFFVVLAPSNTAQLGSSGISLLDFASKAVPLRLRPGGAAVAAAAAGGAADQDPVDSGRLPPKLREDDSDAEQPEVTEVRDKKGRSSDGFLVARSLLSANAVPPVYTKDDILKSPLAKLHPDLQVQVLRPPEEILIARSPVVALKYPAVPMLVAVPVPEVAPESAPAPPALLPLQSMQPLQPHAAPTSLNEAAAPSPMDEAPAAPAVQDAAPVVPEAAVAAVPVAVAEDVPAPAPEAALDETAEAAAPAAVAVAAPEADPAAPAEAAAAAVFDATPVVVPEVVPEVAVVPAADSPAAAQASEPAAQPSDETNQVEAEIAKKEPEPAEEEPILEAIQKPKVHLIGTGIEDCGPARTRNEEGVCVDAVERD